MSNILQQLRVRPERLNWKTSWRTLQDRLNDRLTSFDPARDDDRRQLLVDILADMKLIEKGTLIP